MGSIFYDRVHKSSRPRWWHARAYYDPCRDSYLMVIYPFHWVVNLAWWLNIKWADHRFKESWIDRKLREKASK